MGGTSQMEPTCGRPGHGRPADAGGRRECAIRLLGMRFPRMWSLAPHAGPGKTQTARPCS